MLWVKMYPAKCLRGSLRFDLPYSRRAIWYELILMAGDSDEGGVINCPVSFIASQLGCPLKVLEETLSVLETTGRISLSINKITLLSWQKYQPDRQKPYRARSEGIQRPPVGERNANNDPLGVYYDPDGMNLEGKGFTEREKAIIEKAYAEAYEED